MHVETDCAKAVKGLAFPGEREDRELETSIKQCREKDRRLVL
jgi:hypothetical protein